MVKLSYQEINKLINRTNATFYISGLPEKDCLNTGKEILYDYRKKSSDSSVIVVKHYEKLEASRVFEKRPLSLTFMLMTFAYLFVMIYLFVYLCNSYNTITANIWILYSLFLLVPGVMLYPITRRRIFLYKVLGYDVDALSDVISWVFFIVQMLTIILLASGINMVLAHFSGFDRVTSLVACLMVVSVIVCYLILIHTRIFKPGRTIIKFNHIKKHGKVSTSDINYDTGNINVLGDEDIEVAESTGDLEEIRNLINNPVNNDIDFDFLEDEATIIGIETLIDLEAIKTGEIIKEEIEEEVITPFDKLMDKIVLSDIDTMISKDNSDILVDKNAYEYSMEEDTIDEEEMENNVDFNINDIKNVINNK